MRCPRVPSSLLLSLLALSLLSSCFLAGYDERAPDDMDAGEGGVAPEPDAAFPDGGDAAELRDSEVEPGAQDATASDARVDGSARDADTRDASPRDADTRDADTRDSGVAPDAADAFVEVDAAPVHDAGPPLANDASIDLVDAGPDATMGVDAGGANADGGSTPPDAGVSDAGSDACGPSGCVVTQTCTGSECDLVCTEPPDPGTEVTLDCKFECRGQNRCATTCSASNTCQSNCTSTNVCRSTCPYSAFCINNCTNVSDCGGTCNTGSTCVFNCTASTCNQITCALGAACRVKCSGGGTCDFAYCGNLVGGSCSDGSIVCGRLCP